MPAVPASAQCRQCVPAQIGGLGGGDTGGEHFFVPSDQGGRDAQFGVLHAAVTSPGAQVLAEPLVGQPVHGMASLARLDDVAARGGQRPERVIAGISGAVGGDGGGDQGPDVIGQPAALLGGQVSFPPRSSATG